MTALEQSKLAQAKLACARAANREGKPMVVLLWNDFGASYVIREWDERFIGDSSLVWRCYPSTIDGDG